MFPFRHARSSHFKAKNLDSSETSLPVTIQILGKHSLCLPRSTHPTPRPALSTRVFPKVFSWVTTAPTSPAWTSMRDFPPAFCGHSFYQLLRWSAQAHQKPRLVTSRVGYRASTLGARDLKLNSGEVASNMRIPRSGELEWVQVRLAGSGPKGAHVDRSRRNECVRRGLAEGLRRGRGRKGKGKRGAGPIRVQLPVAPGL